MEKKYCDNEELKSCSEKKYITNSDILVTKEGTSDLHNFHFLMLLVSKFHTTRARICLFLFRNHVSLERKKAPCLRGESDIAACPHEEICFYLFMIILVSKSTVD